MLSLPRAFSAPTAGVRVAAPTLFLIVSSGLRDRSSWNDLLSLLPRYSRNVIEGRVIVQNNRAVVFRNRRREYIRSPSNTMLAACANNAQTSRARSTIFGVGGRSTKPVFRKAAILRGLSSGATATSGLPHTNGLSNTSPRRRRSATNARAALTVATLVFVPSSRAAAPSCSSSISITVRVKISSVR